MCDMCDNMLCFVIFVTFFLFFFGSTIYYTAYGGRPCVMTLKLKGLSNKTTLILSITRELDRVPNTK